MFCTAYDPPIVEVWMPIPAQRLRNQKIPGVVHCMYRNPYIYIYIYIYMHIYIYMRINYTFFIDVCMYVYIYNFVCLHITFIYIYIYTVYIHVTIQLRLLRPTHVTSPSSVSLRFFISSSRARVARSSATAQTKNQWVMAIPPMYIIYIIYV